MKSVVKIMMLLIMLLIMFKIMMLLIMLIMIMIMFDKYDDNNGLVQFYKLFSSKMSIVSVKVSAVTFIL